MRISWQVPFAVQQPVHPDRASSPGTLSRKIDAEVRAPAHPGADRRQAPGGRAVLRARGTGRPARPGRRTTTASATTASTRPTRGAQRDARLLHARRPATPETFVFTAFGDQGVSYDALANDQLILGQNPAFHLHAGDICYADTHRVTARRVGHVRRPRLGPVPRADGDRSRRSVPWMVTTGNHDMEAWYSPDGYGGQIGPLVAAGQRPRPGGPAGRLLVRARQRRRGRARRERRLVRDPRQLRATRDGKQTALARPAAR